MNLMQCDQQATVRRGFWGEVTQSHGHTPLEREEKKKGSKGRNGVNRSGPSDPPVGHPVSDLGVTCDRVTSVTLKFIKSGGQNGISKIST